MRTFVNNDIYNAIPSELKNAITDTTVVSGHGSEDTENFTSTDKLYLLSLDEVNASGPFNSEAGITRTLDYYIDIISRGIVNTKAKKIYESRNKDWWLRTAGSSANTSFAYLGTEVMGSGASSSRGISPAFRIG